MHPQQIVRYSRQIILDGIGKAGQERLLRSKALVVGAGGLGSPALYYLAAAGVGTLGVVDFDTVDASNLQRQILHSVADLGRRKTDSAAERLAGLNPDVKIMAHPERIVADNAERIIGGYDVVIDASDNFATRYLVSDCCYFLRKPLVEGAVLGFEGILFSVVPGFTPCYRCLYPLPPEDGAVPTCADVGILGAVAGVVGSLQALEAVKLLLGAGETCSGRVLLFDGLRTRFRELAWPRRRECPLCGEAPVINDWRGGPEGKNAGEKARPFL